MNNIRIIRKGINVSKILKQLQQYPEDWGHQQNLKDRQILDDRYIVEAGVLQLVIGTITDPNEYVFDSEGTIPTPAYKHHTEAVNFLKRHFKDFRRTAFLSLPVGGKVGRHTDFGKYYLTKDRYHLSIQGRYKYTVGDESIIVEPGTLFWFNNKLEHESENVGDVERITLVFDVPHSKNNP